MKKLTLAFLLVLICSCESADKLAKTQKVLAEYDKTHEGKYTMNAAVGTQESTVEIILDHDLHMWYYCQSLYEIAQKLESKNLKYDRYSITDPKKKVAWRIEGSELPEITNLIEKSKEAEYYLRMKKYDKFLSVSDLDILGVPDTSIIQMIDELKYTDAVYRGFAFSTQNMQGTEYKLMHTFFATNENKDLTITISKKNGKVFGVQY